MESVMGMSRRTTGPAVVFFFLAVRAASVFAQDQSDSFYRNLAAKGKEAFEKGEFEAAAGSFEVARFGFLDNPPRLVECFIYLVSAHAELGNAEKRDHYLGEIGRLKLEKYIDEAKIPRDLLKNLERWKPAAAPPSAGQAGAADVRGTVQIGDIVPIEDVDVPPQVVVSVEPIYPPSALQSRTSGAVHLLALISENGEVLDVKIAPGTSEMMGIAQAAEQALREWKFKPAKKNDIRVKVWKKVTIDFQFKR